jgi:hypothetical protein
MSTPASTIISHFLETQPDNVRWIWEQHRFDVELTEVAQWIRDGDAIAVSDGSFKIPMGTSSCRILNRHHEQTIVTGTNFVPGRSDDQSSYRSEAAGMFSIVIFVNLIVEYYEIQEVTIEVACDGIEALRAISRESQTPQSGSNSFDIVAPARKNLSQSPLRWTFRHVKGHQDKPRDEFDIWERLNDN